MKTKSIFQVLKTFKQAKIHYRLDAFDPDVITLTASVPGQLWEVQFFSDRPPEIEIFKSDGHIVFLDSDTLAQLVSTWGD